MNKLFLSSLLVCFLCTGLNWAHAYNTPPRHIVIIVMENKSYSSIIGNSSAPYINSLANNNSLATNYYANHHPSLPNYIEMVAGSNMGITDDKETHVLSGQFIARQLAEANYLSKVYAENMPSWEPNARPCKFPTKDSYVKRHVAYAFWDWLEGLNGYSGHCSLVQPYTNFDPNHLAGVTWVIANLCHDMHDCGISTGDNWLKNNVPRILNHMSSHDFLILTWDEGSNGAYGGGHVATILAGPGAKKRYKDPSFYQHDSILRTIQNVFHLGCLRNSCNARGFGNMLQ